MKILIDEMRDGLDRELKANGYDAHSVRKLVEKGMKLKSDYSILKYAEKHGMILITEDADNIEGCKENDISCVMFGQKDDIRTLLEKLEILKYGVA